MFLKRVTLFRCFGFDVKADGSWLFLSVLIVWALSTNVFPHSYPGHSIDTYRLMAMVTLGGLILSIIAHEVAHAVIAEYYHMPIAGITLFIFGGVAEMKGEPSHPKGEFLMALAGPAMSGLLGLFFLAIEQLHELHLGHGPVPQVLEYLGVINLMLAAFNMLPAFPLDGGRALRAAIWHYKKNLVLATRIASALGAIFAYGLMVYACYRIALDNDLIAGMWIGLIGLFLHGAGSQAVRQTESRALLAVEKVARFMHGQVVTVPPSLVLNELIEKYVYQHYQRSFPVVENGQLEGIVTLQSLLAMDRSKWPWLHVGSVMERTSENNTVPPDYSAADALDHMQRQHRPALMVAEKGRFLGIVEFSDLAAYLSVTMKVDYNRPVSKSR